MLSLIGVSNIINHFLPFISVPIVQIALGVLVAVLSPGLHITMEPELFFLLFIAPLLFNDGKRVPRDELWNLRAPILMLALGLVFATVLVAGYVIHWLIPSIPLPAAFALAAILSPTDAVAVGALSKRIHLPKSILHLLEGESLMNDASGLVAFKFAIAATVTGIFSLGEATISFLMISLGGLLSGALFAALIIRLRLFIRRLGIEDVTFHMLIQILTPFVIYLGAEHLGVSGILAVVAGGIVHAVERDRAESPMVKLQVVSASTWSVILFVLNGLVFILLGLQIPDVSTVIFKNAAISNVQVIGYICFISITLMILRFIWIYLFWEGTWILETKERTNKPNVKALTLLSLSGVRGAVTLAGAFSIPLFLQDGSPFPERDLIIFIAAGVILFTLITASFILPLLSKKKETGGEQNQDMLEKTVRIKIMEEVIQVMKEESSDTDEKATLSIISYYNKLIKQARHEEKGYSLNLHARKAETKLWLVALDAEQQEIQRLLEKGEISLHTAYKFQENLNQMEMLMTNKIKSRVMLLFLILKKFLRKFFTEKKGLPKGVSAIEKFETIKKVKIQTSKAAIRAITDQINDKNKHAAMAIIDHYEEMIERLRRAFEKDLNNKSFAKHKKELHFKAAQIARNEIQVLYENGEINREIAGNLRRFINQIEANVLEEESVGAS